VMEMVIKQSDAKMAEKAVRYGPEIMRSLEKSIFLQILDQSWRDHLLTLDHLREGINLRAYGQKDPLNEYKREAFELFNSMLASFRETTVSILSHVEVQFNAPAENVMPQEKMNIKESRGEDDSVAQNTGHQPAVSDKIQRNAPCPCGSGKKYKHCHGAVE